MRKDLERMIRTGIDDCLSGVEGGLEGRVLARIRRERRGPARLTVAMAAVMIALVCKHLRIREKRLCPVQGDGDLTLYVLVVAFLSQYLPWVLVPRSMYIYHYFASVPFIILATAWWLGKLCKENRKLTCILIAVYLAVALVFFVLFYPYASGMLTSTRWLDAMKWFPGKLFTWLPELFGNYGAWGFGYLYY